MQIRLLVLSLALIAVLLTGCGRGGSSPQPGATQPAPTAPAATVAPSGGYPAPNAADPAASPAGYPAPTP